ncbi:hypothetical protein SCA6_002305 [Theobroma cacao]
MTETGEYVSHSWSTIFVGVLGLVYLREVYAVSGVERFILTLHITSFPNGESTNYFVIKSSSVEVLHSHLDSCGFLRCIKLFVAHSLTLPCCLKHFLWHNHKK